MASITAAELKWYLSGGATNEDPNASLGGVRSTTEVVDDTLHNLFDEVGGSEHTAGDTEYRCIYLKNTNGATTAENVKLYIETNTPSGESSIQIGLDLAGVSDNADTIPDENTAPSPAVTFSTADGIGNALTIPDILHDQALGIWIKRIITAGSTPYSSDNVVIKLSVDTL